MEILCFFEGLALYKCLVRYLFRKDFNVFMTYHIMAKSQFVMESQGYKFIKQAVIVSKEFSSRLFLRVFKEELQAILALCHSFKGLNKCKL